MRFEAGFKQYRRAAMRVIVGACLGLAAFGGGTFAQTVPPSIDPGRLPQRFEPPRPPTVDRRIEVPTIPSIVPPERAREVRIVLRGIVVTGSTVYGVEQFREYYQNLVGREVSLLEVYGIANQITARYRNDGYILSQAVVPQQQIRDGVVQIQIVEGRIARVVIRDEGKLSSYTPLLQYAKRLQEFRGP